MENGRMKTKAVKKTILIIVEVLSFLLAVVSFVFSKNVQSKVEKIEKMDNSFNTYTNSVITNNSGMSLKDYDYLDTKNMID